jgi:hypothetical protein
MMPGAEQAKPTTLQETEEEVVVAGATRAPGRTAQSTAYTLCRTMAGVRQLRLVLQRSPVPTSVEVAEAVVLMMTGALGEAAEVPAEDSWF